MKKITILSVVASSLLFVTTTANANSTTTTTKTKVITVKELKAQLKKEIKSELLEELKAECAQEQKASNTKYTFNKLYAGASHEPHAKAPIQEHAKTPAPSEGKAVKVNFKLETGHPDTKLNEIISAVAGGTATAAAAATTAAKSTDKKKTDNSDVFDYKVKPKKIAENVWCFFGALDKPTKENAGFMSNSCYVKTSEGYVTFDTGPSYQFAKQAYAAMQKIEDLPVKYVIDTHGHDDHWLGNGFYKEKFNAPIIGPESINTLYKEGDLTRMYKTLPENAIRGTHIIKVDKPIKEPTTLKVGDTEFQLTPIPTRAHSVDDIYTYLPKQKILFAGDLVMNGRITSNRDGTLIGQIKALDMIDKVDWKILVPGHGLITDETAADESKLYFKLMKERVSKAIEDDVDSTEINDVVKLEEFKDKAMYDILNAHNVGFAFDELEMLDED